MTDGTVRAWGFDRIADPDPGMRRDPSELIGRASRTRRDVFVLVNNEAEGSAPLTVRALAGQVAASGGGTSQAVEGPGGAGGA